MMYNFWDCKRIKCGGCGKYFTALTDTFLSGSHMSFREIILLAFLLGLNVADKQIAAVMKMSQENIRLWRHRFEALARAKKISSGENNGN
jgi:transposase-like protein